MCLSTLIQHPLPVVINIRRRSAPGPKTARWCSQSPTIGSFPFGRHRAHGCLDHVVVRRKKLLGRPGVSRHSANSRQPIPHVALQLVSCSSSFLCAVKQQTLRAVGGSRPPACSLRTLQPPPWSSSCSIFAIARRQSMRGIAFLHDHRFDDMTFTW